MPGFLRGILFLFTAFGLSACCFSVCEQMMPSISFVIQNQAGENLVETGAIAEDEIKLFAKNGSEFFGRSSYTSPGSFLRFLEQY
jgi:hypothetical protein